MAPAAGATNSERSTTLSAARAAFSLESNNGERSAVYGFRVRGLGFRDGSCLGGLGSLGCKVLDVGFRTSGFSHLGLGVQGVVGCGLLI